MESNSDKSGIEECKHPFIIGDNFIKNCKICGLFMPKVLKDFL